MEGSSVSENENLSLSNHDYSLQSKNSHAKEIHCPFTWEECTARFDEINWVEYLNFKLSKPSNDWTKFCKKMLLGCIYSHRKEEEEADQLFYACEKILEDTKNEKFFEEIIEGLQHVLSSCRMFLYTNIGKQEASMKMLSSIKSFNELNRVNQAAVLAVKASILRRFGHTAKLEALNCAMQATELDPDDYGNRKGSWYYLAGQIHSEIRHTESLKKMPSEIEIELLERSIKKDPFPMHFILLADIYREYAKHLQKYQAEELFSEAKEKYENAINDENASLDILNRAGMGVMKLPYPFRNVELAKSAFERALSIHSTRYTLIGMGYLLSWHMHDYKEALKYFEQAYSSDGLKAGLQIIKMKSKIDKYYNPLEDCNKCIEDLEKMMTNRAKSDLNVFYLMVKAEFYLIKKRDFLAAVHELKKAIDVLDVSKNIWEYQCMFANKHEIKSWNLMLDEIYQARRLEKFNNTDEDYLKIMLKRFQEKRYNWRKN